MPWGEGSGLSRETASSELESVASLPKASCPTCSDASLLITVSLGCVQADLRETGSAGPTRPDVYSLSPEGGPSGLWAMAEAGAVGVYYDIDPSCLNSCLPYLLPSSATKAQLTRLLSCSPASPPHHSTSAPPPAPPTLYNSSSLLQPPATFLLFSPGLWEISGWPFRDNHQMLLGDPSQTPAMSSSRTVSSWCPRR